MAVVTPHITIITLNLNEFNSTIKKHRVADLKNNNKQNKNQLYYASMLSSGDSTLKTEAQSGWGER